METQESIVCVGIDIAKLKFDAAITKKTGKPANNVFSNDPNGFRRLLTWLSYAVPGSTYHFCMEATGSYHEALAMYLADAGLRVSVVNPNRTHHAAKASGAGNKTDGAEARQLAEYCRKENPPLWRQAKPDVRALRAMMRRLHSLNEMLTQERNRLADPSASGQVEVIASFEKSIAFINGEIDRLIKQIKSHINNHPDLKADHKLLTSIPGIGEILSAWLLAELPDVNQIPSAKSAAAFAGTAPSEHTSGTSVHKRTHMSKSGNAHIRRALYMPALCATRCNPAVKGIYDRLIAKGRPKMVALGAAMRKLIMIAYGVLKSRKEFNFNPAHS